MISPSQPFGGGTLSRTTQVLIHKASGSADTSFPVPDVIPPSLSQKRVIALDAPIQLRDGCRGPSFCLVGPHQTRSGPGLCTRRLNAVESRGSSNVTLRNLLLGYTCFSSDVPHLTRT